MGAMTTSPAGGACIALRHMIFTHSEFSVSQGRIFIRRQHFYLFFSSLFTVSFRGCISLSCGASAGAQAHHRTYFRQSGQRFGRVSTHIRATKITSRYLWLFRPQALLALSHPTAGAALFGPKKKKTDRLSSSTAKLSVRTSYDNITIIFLLGLAHRTVGRFARTNAFQVMFRMKH